MTARERSDLSTARQCRGPVLHAIQSAALGGSESTFLALTRALSAAGWPLIFAIGEEGWLGGQVRAIGIPVHVIPGLGQGGGFGLRSVKALYRLILTHDCGLVHAMMFPTHLYACLAARLAGRPCIVNIRNSHHDLVGRRRRFLWRRAIGPLGPSIVTVTEALADEARELTRSARVTCIHNGIDADAHLPRGDRWAVRAELGIPKDAVVIGTVGNLRPVKGHADLIRAAGLVAKEHAPIRVLLVGAEHEPTAGGLRRLCQESGLSEQVVFLGYREDIPELMQVMDIFCLPSHSEGMSGALLQAMAAGLPAIATDVGGNREAVLDGETGLLVPPRDPAQLAAALLRLVESPGLRQRMAEAGAVHARTRFAFRPMVSRYIELYEASIASSTSAISQSRRAFP